MKKEPITEERTNGPTPNGGAYSVAYYLNDNWEPIDRDEATTVIIHECAEDGRMINEIICH